MGSPTLADLQAVPLAAWRGVMDPDSCTDAGEINAAIGWGLIDGDRSPTPKGTRYLAALRSWAKSMGVTEEQRDYYRESADGSRAFMLTKLGTEGELSTLGRAALLLLEVDRG